MKPLLYLSLVWALAASAQTMTRPQLSVESERGFQVANYLAQGPTPWTPAALTVQPAQQPDFVVSADGLGTHKTLQAAIDAVPAKGLATRRYVVGLTSGQYVGQVCIQGKSPLLLVGLGAAAADVRIVASRYAGETISPGQSRGTPCLTNASDTTVGTAGTATLAVFSDDVQMVHLTVENDAMNAVRNGIRYPSGAAEPAGAQAVALMTQGDRIQLEDVRLLGHQDTLYVRSPSPATGDRVYIHRSVLAGDVDFIFGAGTLVLDDCTILSRAGRRSAGEVGYVLAPSTPVTKPLGILVNNSRLVGEPGLVPASIGLGRAWDAGVPKGTWQAGVSPNGQALIRNSVLGPHLGGWATSTSRRPFQTTGEQANRFNEWDNHPPERERLAPRDGWASAQGGTAGGADAAPENVFVVHNRKDLVAALTPLSTPKPRIVRVVGRIDLSAADDGRSMGLADFKDPAFDQVAFNAAYDPAVWGKTPPAGPLEEARQRSARRQADHVVVRVPADTTIIGDGADASIVNGTLFLDKVNNVIIRNIHFSDAYDYFPAWDPKDNATGEWNSEYDNVTLRGATHVWVDHCTFDDGARPDQAEPIALGRRVQHHDGLLDITQQSNFVTVSWNHFHDHDKTNLVGSSDGQQLDRDKLKITFHHNLWENVKERTPRVRYGQVHLYNNLYAGRSDAAYPYGYSIGVGVNSHIFSERNVWETSPDVHAARLTHWWKGNAFFDRESRHNGQPVDLLGALQAANPGAVISADVGWSPDLYLSIDPTAEVATKVRTGAGAGHMY